MNYKLLIITILIAGFGIVGASVYVGYALRDGEVVDNAYEAGIKFDEATKKQAQLGWQVELPRTMSTAKEDVTIMTVLVKERDGKGLTDATVLLELNRMGNRIVRTYQCSGGSNGRYTASVVFDEPGYWETRVHVARRGDSLTFDDNINIVQ
jgi:nitrogen fixation protein FixH